MSTLERASYPNGQADRQFSAQRQLQGKPIIRLVYWVSLPAGADSFEESGD